MLSTDVILRDIGERVVTQLRNDIKSKVLVAGFPPANASGKLADSIRYDISGSVLRVYALDYIYYLEQGRKPGKKPPITVIRKWIEDKGILPKPDAKGRTPSMNSLAFLIQRAIGEKGTMIYQQGGSNLLSGIINESFLQQTKEELMFSIVNSIRSDVLKVAA